MSPSLATPHCATEVRAKCMPHYPGFDGFLLALACLCMALWCCRPRACWSWRPADRRRSEPDADPQAPLQVPRSTCLATWTAMRQCSTAGHDGVARDPASPSLSPVSPTSAQLRMVPVVHMDAALQAIDDLHATVTALSVGADESDSDLESASVARPLAMTPCMHENMWQMTVAPWQAQPHLDCIRFAAGWQQLRSTAPTQAPQHSEAAMGMFARFPSLRHKGTTCAWLQSACSKGEAKRGIDTEGALQWRMRLLQASGPATQCWRQRQGRTSPMRSC